MTYGKFLQYTGTLLLMATTFIHNKRDFWDNKPVNKYEGAPFCFSPAEGDMSGSRFRAITAAMAYAKETSRPTYQDKFWEVRDFMEAWNTNMSEKFTPAFISCLEESMSKSLNQYTTPGFVVCPRKPWPLGSWYHTIACGKSGILYALEIVQGKDEPPERPAKHTQIWARRLGCDCA